MTCRLGLAAFVLSGVAVSASNAVADTDLLDLTAAERAAFGQEIRSLLRDEPEIVGHALNPPSPVAQAMRQDIDDDLELIARLAPGILAGHDIALFVGPDCGTCDRATSELKEISKDYGTTFILHDTHDKDAITLARQLGMDDLPFYVLPDMILRGHIPQVVLPRYLR